MRADPSITIGIPIYNEEKTLPELLNRVKRVIEELPGESHELLLVDDGSTDSSLSLLTSFAEKVYPHTTIISFSRNFGHQAALSAILSHSSKDVVVLMDGDLQDPPESIPLFLEKYKDGYDVVYAVRKGRKEGFIVRLCSFLFYRMINSLSPIYLPLDSGDFSMISRNVVEAINSTGEYHRYIRGLRAWAGFKQIGIPIERSARLAGHSKYGFSGLLKLAIDGIFSFSIIPLRMSLILGAFTVIASFMFALYALFVKLFFNTSPTGFTSLFLTMVFMSGIQLVFLGVIGEYIGRIYSQTKGRPIFIIGQIIKGK